MIRRHVLAALAAGVAAGDDDAARAAVKQIDWVLRRPARRRLERALVDAALEVPALGTEPDEVRHVQRIAALAVAGRRFDPEDRERVAAAYRALRMPPPPRVWSATIVAALVAVVVLGGVGRAAIRAWPRAGSRTYAPPLPPPSATAFRDGGQPLVDPPIAALLARELTDLVIAIDTDRNSSMIPERLARSVALMEPPVIAAHGPALAGAWRAMITMLDRWRRMPSDDTMFDDMSRALTDTVRKVSDQLAAVGLGYYLEVNVLSSARAAHAVLHAYRVEEVVFVSVAGAPRRVLSLRRLDQLNVTHSMLGMESQELGGPVLLLDRIEAHVASRTLPALAHGAPYQLGDPGWAARDDSHAVAVAAGEAVRRELARCLGQDLDDGAEVAALLAERAAIVARWRDDLARRQIAIAETDAVFLPDELVTRLDGLVPASQRRRVVAIEDELAQLGAARIASRLRDVVADTIRRHEAQHSLDQERGPQWATQPATTEGLRAIPAHARTELSAYISQIANDPVTPQLAYWHIAGFAFDRRAWGSSESYAGVAITAGLARRLKLPTDPLIHDGEIDRTRLARVAAAIAEQSDDALRAAARETWQDLFGEPLAAIVDRPPSEHRAFP